MADDLRADVEKWLDEADALLVREPMAGELVDEIMRRHILAQHLILRAQSQIARRSLTQVTEES